MPTQTLRKRKSAVGLLALPISLSGVLAIFCLFPRAQESHALQLSIASAAIAIVIFAAAVRHRVLAAGRTLTLEVLLRPPHYVQLVMHASIYAYWGWYWPEVYHFVPLILVQIVYTYALDMLVCWSRRDRWVAGFGPVPIILSTNLFLWFRDDWFILQFVMISIGVIGKEYFTWMRDGRRTHIFNPSAVGLFIFSIILIATHTTSITWGEQIATTLHRPPNIYLEIFVLGLIVQALFQVTLVTLSAAAALIGMGLIYTHTTGVYQFIDSNIPVSVFIGLHLLVTDPATSPRSNSGKIAFGGLYGMSVFGLYSLLSLMEAPRFYDKLLCVPLLNLCVRWLDRVGYAADKWFVSFFRRIHAPRFTWAGTPRQVNFAFMSIWIAIFGTLMYTGFFPTEVAGKTTHPGSDPQFWRQACDAHRHKACTAWVGMLNAKCEDGTGSACLKMAQVNDAGVVVPRNVKAAGRGYGRACDLGEPGACPIFLDFVSHGGEQSLAKACDDDDGFSCFYLATVLHLGQGAPQDEPRALHLFQQACNHGYVRGCGVMGDMFLAGQGSPVDAPKALVNYDRSCAGGWGQSCAAAASLYRSGVAGSRDELLAQKRFEEGCDLGFQPACSGSDGSPVDRPITR